MYCIRLGGKYMLKLYNYLLLLLIIFNFRLVFLINFMLFSSKMVEKIFMILEKGIFKIFREF